MTRRHIALILALIAAQGMNAACDIKELRFFNGFTLSLPAGICVDGTSGPDYRIYRFRAAGGRAFLQAYVGNAANFHYFAPPEGLRITEDPVGQKLTCGALVIRETVRKDVTEVGGAVTSDGKGCGESLVRGTSVDGAISSPAIHFWYSGASAEEERVIRKIIDSVRRSAKLPDDPPLTNGG